MIPRSTDIEIPPPRLDILGVPLWGLSLKGFLDLAVDLIRSKRKVLFSTANAHSIVTAQRNAEFMAHFSSADVVLPDGFLPVLASRVLGRSISVRVAGPDFVEAFLSRAAEEGLSVFFAGATEETLSKIRMVCHERYPSLKIAGLLSPPFGDFGEATDRRLVDTINAANPDVLFVGMTAPKQEVWLSRNLYRLNAQLSMGVGAAFDFLAGNKRRAPRWLGQRGFEWLFRLAHEPTRMWRRNLSSFVFIATLARHYGCRRRRVDS